MWLWHRPAAKALIQPLGWEFLCAAGGALKKKKKKRERERKKKKRKQSRDEERN